MNRKVWGIVIALAAVGFVLLLFQNSMTNAQYKVEVCMEFNGQTNCRAASGVDETQALRTAADLACSTIASGMTDSMACTGREPKSIKWLRGK
jgi:hypothetical protein